MASARLHTDVRPDNSKAADWRTQINQQFQGQDCKFERPLASRK